MIVLGHRPDQRVDAALRAAAPTRAGRASEVAGQPHGGSLQDERPELRVPVCSCVDAGGGYLSILPVVFAYSPDDLFDIRLVSRMFELVDVRTIEGLQPDQD